METRDLKNLQFAWWYYKEGDKILVRVVGISNQFVCVRIVAATPEQVLRCGYGITELVNTSARALGPATA